MRCHIRSAECRTRLSGGPMAPDCGPLRPDAAERLLLVRILPETASGASTRPDSQKDMQISITFPPIFMAFPWLFLCSLQQNGFKTTTSWAQKIETSRPRRVSAVRDALRTASLSASAKRLEFRPRLELRSADAARQGRILT